MFRKTARDMLAILNNEQAVIAILFTFGTAVAVAGSILLITVWPRL